MFGSGGVGVGAPGSGEAVGGGDVGVGLVVGPGMTAVSSRTQLLSRSDSADEVETQTVFVMLAEISFATLTISETAMLSPGFTVPNAQVVPLHVPWLAVMDITERTAGNASTMVTDSAADAPLLDTVMK